MQKLMLMQIVKEIPMADIYFRTDGNREIATGHLMRCLAIARACAQNGADVKFIVSDEESLALLQERFTVPQEFHVHCTNCDYRKPEWEIPSLLSWFSSDNGTDERVSAGKPWFFIDSYYVTASYFEALRKHFRTAYLDDLRSHDCAVDLVINYDTDEDCACYAHASRRLLGIQYTPLREQFRTPSYEVRPAVGHILLSTGGTDPYGVAEALLRILYGEPMSCGALPEDSADNRSASCVPQAAQSTLYSAYDMAALRSMHYHILTSRTNSRYDALHALAQKHPTLHIHTNVTAVAELMASCDLAVSAGGTTLCELCAVGVPSISYLMAENQRTAVETYAKKNLIPCAGDIRPVSSSACLTTAGTAAVPCPNPDGPHSEMPNHLTLSRLIEFLCKMAADYPARVKTSSAMRTILDGAGADRIAKALLP